MKIYKNVVLLVFMIAIIGSRSGFCQTEYYYHYDKYVPVENSNEFAAIEIDENLSDWSSFFDSNDYLERLEKPFPMPNGMYLMKFKENVDIDISLESLNNYADVNKVLRAWNHTDAPFIIPTNRIVVYFKEKIASSLADSIALANGITDYGIFLGKDNCYLFRVEGDYYRDALILANEIFESGIANFSQTGFIFPVEARYTPNDPLFSYQWNLKNTGQGGGTPGADIDMEEAWDYAYAPASGGGRVCIRMSILGQGVADHEDLPLYFEELYYPYTYPLDTYPGPYQGHEQAIAGILRGINDNETGISGILKDTDLGENGDIRFPLWFLVIVGPEHPDDWRQVAENIDIANAIYKAWHDHFAFTISISYNLPISTHIDTALAGAYNDGVTVFACAGNVEGSEYPALHLDWPARLPNVIAVGASDYNDQRAGYSYYGLGGVDFLAPSRIATDSGVGIITTDQMGSLGKITVDGLSCLDTTLSADYSCEFGGTSAATPEAAAIAMMIFARRSDFRIDNLYASSEPRSTVYIDSTNRPAPEVIREIIRYSCEDVVNNDEVPGVEDTA